MTREISVVCRIRPLNAKEIRERRQIRFVQKNKYDRKSRIQTDGRTKKMKKKCSDVCTSVSGDGKSVDLVRE